MVVVSLGCTGCSAAFTIAGSPRAYAHVCPYCCCSLVELDRPFPVDAGLIPDEQLTATNGRWREPRPEETVWTFE